MSLASSDPSPNVRRLVAFGSHDAGRFAGLCQNRVREGPDTVGDAGGSIGDNLGTALGEPIAFAYGGALKEELVKAKETSETANKTKSLFLTNMSYELRTPLNGIHESRRLALTQKSWIYKAAPSAWKRNRNRTRYRRAASY